MEIACRHLRWQIMICCGVFRPLVIVFVVHSCDLVKYDCSSEQSVNQVFGLDYGRYVSYDHAIVV